MDIKELIQEEMGVSQEAEEIYEKLKEPNSGFSFGLTPHTNFQGSSNGMWYKISETIYFNDDGEIAFVVYLVIMFVDLPQTIDYPVIDASMAMDPRDKTAKLKMILTDDYKNNTVNDFFNNLSIKRVMYHELHHLIRNQKMGLVSGNSPQFNREKSNSFLNYLTKKGNNEESKLKGLYYYLSKQELGSVVPEFKHGKRKGVIDLFKEFRNMPYDEFVKYVQSVDDGRTPKKREYDQVQDRIEYFFKKIRKLGYS